MKKLFLYLLLLLSNYSFAQQAQLDVQQVAPKVWVHTSYSIFQGVRVPSHGLLVSTSEGAVLIDTGWGNEPTEQLLAWVEANLKQPVKVCVPTHWHDDKMGGAETVQARGIPVVASTLTAKFAAENDKSTPDITFASDTTFIVGGQQFDVYYPGGGHTPDNVVVYLPKQKILFAGCLVKDLQANNLGNIADADLKNWPGAIKNLQKRYPNAKLVVASHGPWGDQALLSHTLQLLQKQKQ